MLKTAHFKFEIVILYCPYANIENKETRDLFSKLIRLKKRGYGNRYASGELPLDTSDFIADHPLICIRDENGQLEPVSGSKVVHYDLCKFFNLEFAMESCFKKGNKTEHLEALANILKETQTDNKRVAYHGGYTIDPILKNNATAAEIIKELFIGSTTSYFKEASVTDLLGLGVPKFKTEQFFYNWGYQRCQWNGADLAEFPLIFLPETNGVMMHLKEFSKHTLEMENKYADLWANRTLVGSPFSFEAKKNRAA